MLVLALILAAGVLAGYAFGGRLRHLSTVRVRWWWLAPIALGIQALPAPALPGTRADLLGVGLLLGSFGLLLVLAAANVRQPGFALMLVGVAMNLVVIAANRGMPVSASALRRAGAAESVAELRGAEGKHHLATGDDVLVPLTDVIPVPGLRVVLSAGDVVAYGGVAVFVAWAMRRPARRGRSRAPRRARRSGTRR
ncbi:MAG TPA: DUF5317 family protein [Actinomycetota bacterium]